MKRLHLLFLGTVLGAPVVFFIYLKLDWVCAPRAIIASALFGGIPFMLVTVALWKEKGIFFYSAGTLLVVEMAITPIIMLNRLGWEKFYGERLLAFFTFEGIALLQILIVGLLWKCFTLPRPSGEADFKDDWVRVFSAPGVYSIKVASHQYCSNNSLSRPSL